MSFRRFVEDLSIGGISPVMIDNGERVEASQLVGEGSLFLRLQNILHQVKPFKLAIC